MKRPFTQATAAALALAVLSLAFLIAAPPALVSGLRAAQRFFELGFHFAASLTLLDHFQAWLRITAPCVILLAALAWLATRPWADSKTTHTGSGRLRLLWPSIRIPAGVFLLLWIAIQIISGVSDWGDETAGVAWWAHVGGFVAGIALGRAMWVRKPTRSRLRI